MSAPDREPRISRALSRRGAVVAGVIGGAAIAAAAVAGTPIRFERTAGHTVQRSLVAPLSTAGNPDALDELSTGPGGNAGQPPVLEGDGPLPAPGSAFPAGIGGRPVAVPILMYHYVRTNPNWHDRIGYQLSVTPQNFAAQMALLRDQHIPTVTLADLMRALNGGPALPRGAAILTFDDGYSDFATQAAPTISADGLRAETFVVSGFLGRRGYMTAQQVQQVAAEGMVVGAHTVDHIDLTRAPATLAQSEIEVSRQVLSSLTGTSVDDFAYPYGRFDARLEAMVQAAGFRDAVTTQYGYVHSLWQRFALRRVQILGSDTLAGFAAKVGLRLAGYRTNDIAPVGENPDASASPVATARLVPAFRSS